MKLHQIKMRPVSIIKKHRETGLGNKAFTLVELIVVITILAILATIAFVSLQGYSASSRDSVRIADASNIKTSLELFVLNTGKYPTPDAYKEVTYSGSVIWEEGTFGEDVLRKVRKFNRSPKDPLQDVYYTYSRLNTQKEYEIGVALERDQVAFQNTQTQAAGEKLAISYITGTYNGLVAQVSTGATTYILAVPTIISTDPTVTDIQTLVTDKKLSYTGYQNIPSSYEGTSLKTQGEPDLVLTNKLVAYSGTTLPGTTGQIGQFVGNLQTAYSGTTISSEPLIATVANVDVNNQVSIQILGGEILNSTLGSNVVLNISTISCNGGSISGLVNTDIIFNYSGLIHNENGTGTGSKSILNGTNQIFTGNILCENGSVSISNEIAGSFTCNNGYEINGSSCNLIPIGSSQTSAGTSCLTIRDSRADIDGTDPSDDGVYWIDPDGIGGTDPMEVDCDMSTDGGGWTYVIGTRYNYGNIWGTGIYCEQLPSTSIGGFASLEYQEAYTTAAGALSTRYNAYNTYTDQKFTLASKAAHLGNCNFNTTRNCQASDTYTCEYVSENIFDQNMLHYTSGDWQPLTVFYDEVGNRFKNNYSYYFTYLKVR